VEKENSVVGYTRGEETRGDLQKLNKEGLIQ